MAPATPTPTMKAPPPPMKQSSASRVNREAAAAGDEDDARADDADSPEPLLKYERVGTHFHAIFKDDSLSCIALHVSFMCVGTYNGNVLLLELDGRFIRRLHQHYKKVNEVCIDETGQENTVHEGEGPVHAIKWKDGLVAWANDWGVKVYDAERDQRITYIERPPQCPPMELCRCHLEWQSSSTLLIGWAHTLRVVAFKKVNPLSPSASTTGNDPATVAAPGTLTAEVVSLITFDFFVGGISVWGSTAVCVLAYRPPGSAPAGVKSQKNEQRLVEGEGDAADIPFPEVHVVGLDGKQASADILNLKGYYKLRASDYKMPSLQFTHANTAPDGASIYDAGYGKLQYICAPKDVVICRLRDVDDRVAWALSRKQYEKALNVALGDAKSLRKHSMEELMEFHLSELLKKKQYKKAADEIRRLFVGEEFAVLWEKYVYVFAQRGQLTAIAKYIPTTAPRLPTVQYEMVLKHFMDSDPGQLLEIIRKWPKPRRHDTVRSKSGASSGPSTVAVTAAAPEYTQSAFVFEPLYDAQQWINQLEAVVRRRRIAESDADKISLETSYIMEALAELYTATEQFDHALRIYLSQGAFCTNKDHAFKLITEHQLWALVQNKIINLMHIDRANAVRMIVQQTEHVKIFDVVKQLEHDRELLHEYLHELFVHRLSEYNTELYSTLHETQVALYTEFAPNYLLKFLQTSNFVPLEKAFKFCSERSPPLWDAMIYILGRMGQHKRALDLILTQMRDINQAIQFVQENDASLWDYLIDLSLTTKENVEELLKFASQHKIDPIKLMKKIPEDMVIDNLKDKLTEIIANYRIQQNLCEGCNKVFQNDRVELLRSQVAVRKRGRRVAPRQQCVVCSEHIRPPTSGKDSVHMCAFECGHHYHLPCLVEKMRMWKRAEIVEDGNLNALRESLGCFVCDHSTRAYARSTTHLDVVVEKPPRGITEDQLQRAKDVLTLKMAA
ncbi:hypothetical protein P43SY_006985 [Pythium insidiosum]|uniref:RING-type domain-containing protein n=1 Tax=Pythium insidiosum TaxID=114742 RepID=A0AAD5LQU3_PYTIN|nr:hypothetical protein P43SY_006985 [Pythium insidiosum]